jgi:diguanylate cyclase (GGDEF)-like protein
MPSPGTPAPPRTALDDSYLELLSDTLESLDVPARGQFLQRYLRAVTHLDLRETACIQIWEEMLQRRQQLSDALKRTVSLKTALMDVLTTAGLLRVPVLIEYDELKKIQLNAVTDPLTGLYNRRIFAESFERELNRAKRYGLPFGLVMMDMHRFKEVNDKHGHPRGDEVLKVAATTLKKALRTSDLAFRIGGDEFALILPQTDAAQALALSRRVETVFEESLKVLQLSVTVGLDHGVANYPQDGDSSDDLIRIADGRLYQRKPSHAGRTPEPAPAPVSSAPPQPAAPPAATPPPAEEKTSPAPSPISIETKRPAEKKEEKKEEAAPRVEPAAPAESSAPAPAASSPLSTTSEPATPAATSPQSVPPAPSPISAQPSAISQTQRTFTVPRKAERVSMTGTNAYAVLGEHGARRARVLDLGFGGVALELESSEALAEVVLAILHVPILPPVRVNLKPIWSHRTDLGLYRIGCTFVS